MKLITTNRIFVLSCLTLLTLLFSNCKEKGCTNPDALNYNSVADEDDGSCIICTRLAKKEIAARDVSLIDRNFSSPYNNQTVGIFKLNQQSVQYNDEKCGPGQCYVEVQIQNLINKRIEFEYQLSVSGSNFIQHQVVIEPFQTVKQDSIPLNFNNTCSPITNSNLNVVNGYISYN